VSLCDDWNMALYNRRPLFVFIMCSCVAAVFVVVAGQSTTVDDSDGDNTTDLHSVVAQLIRDVATLQVELTMSLAKIAKLEETADHNCKYRRIPFDLSVQGQINLLLLLCYY